MNKRLENNKELFAERVKNMMSLINLEGSNEEEINAIQQLIEKYAGGFGLDGEPLPATHLITHKINMSTNKPIKAKQYRYPPKLQEQLQKEIDKLMEGDIIEPAASQYCSPTWIVPKHAEKDGNKQ
jgi:predicted house-cleaning noncanonical NTP pyrophosphatase (MazG superfamily)